MTYKNNSSNNRVKKKIENKLIQYSINLNPTICVLIEVLLLPEEVGGLERNDYLGGILALEDTHSFL